MTCTNPYYLQKQNIYVPCGRCRPCRVNRAQEWSTRMVHEATQHQDSAFVTLTYDEQHLEPGVTKRTAQLFIKRLRRNLPNKPLKYYLCGEYGSETQRPHYHAIIFGLETCNKCRVCYKVYRLRGKTPEPGTDCAALEKAWDKGIVDAGTVTPASTRYVADYLQKDTHINSKYPAFAIMSQGIGKTWAEKNVTLKTCIAGLNKGTGKIPVPRYYQKKLAETDENNLTEYIIRNAKLRQVQKNEKRRDNFWIQRGQTPLQSKIKADYQAERDLIAYQRLRTAKI